MKKLPLLITLFFTTSLLGQTTLEKDLSKFLPKGYFIFDTATGDLNKDGLVDYVLIIKGKDKSKIIKDEHRKELDRNRRGIIVLFKQKDKYEVAVKNYKCFSSENEDGGIYFPPELYIQIDKGNLTISYAHGRYGYWKYTFRFKNSDFELIGFDSSEDRGPVINTETSINFLTKKKITRKNTNENPEQESGDEIFKETRTNITIDKLLKLSTIKDFDELDMSY